MEINICSIEGFQIGNAQDIKAATGCTAIIAKDGATAGVATYGGAPASRETELLRSEKMVQKIHAVMLCGGSAYGLDAASGAMRYLEENNIGFSVGKGVVPIVSAASIFDLNVGSFDVRPNVDMGYAACVDSQNQKLKQGNYGAGTGASVGKYLGEAQSMKSGLGFYAQDFDGVKVGAIVVLNALGDIYSAESGKQIAGLLRKDKNEFLDTQKMISIISPTLTCLVKLKNSASSVLLSFCKISFKWFWSLPMSLSFFTTAFSILKTGRGFFCPYGS